MKKILLSLTLFCILTLNLNALTMKEKIQQDLSKVGIKHEIIDETVKLDKETGEGFTTKNEDGEVLTEDRDKWEKIYLKDKRNYVALERLIEFYFLTRTENDPKKEKYISEYLKTNISEDRKNFVLGKNFWISSKEKTEKNKYFEKVKSISNNQYYLKVIDFFEYLSKESQNINQDNNLKTVKPKIDEIMQKMEEIDKILNNKDLRKKYRISDEEAYSDQLIFFMAGGILKAVAGDTEGMVNDFINKIANKKISKEVAEYNKNKEMMTVMTIQMTMALKGFFGEMSEKEITKLEKLTKKLQDTEMFKRIMENSEKEETIESDIHLEDKRKKFEAFSDDEQIKRIVAQKKFILIFGKREEDEEISEGVFLRKGTDSKGNEFYVYDDENKDKILTVFVGQNENLDFFKFVNEILGESYKNIEAKYGGRD